MRQRPFTSLPSFSTLQRGLVAREADRIHLPRQCRLCISAIHQDNGWNLRRHYGDESKQDMRNEGRRGKGYWQDKSNLSKALDRAEKELGIEKPEDWNAVKLTDLEEIGIPGLRLGRRRLVEMLEERYPYHSWDKAYRIGGKYGLQKQLEKLVASLFPEEEIKINVRKEANLITTGGEYLELDIYIPSLNLAFEYQEKHHYTTTDYTFLPMEVYEQRDAKKRELVKEKGLTLIIVPFWWDGSTESLVASIKEMRPELLPNVSLTEGTQPIPKEMPPEAIKQIQQIEGIGEPTNACFFTNSGIEPEQWWMFEKYDGVRGFWNPEQKVFVSRKGNKFLNMPRHIIDSMPTDLWLDGELWFGRDNFQEAMKIALRMDESEIDWSKFKYMVYDAPKYSGTYEQRYSYMVEQLSHRPWRYVEVARFEECKNMEHLEGFFQDIIDKGGEGIILRDPDSPLQGGRSAGYLKHKKFRDAEAKIVQLVGAHQWECELPNGIHFVAPAGTAEFTKRWQPKPGDVVSFKHRGFMLTSKKPKFPMLHRVRSDLTWSDVVNNWREQRTSIPSAPPIRRPTARAFPRGFWQDRENRRKFFTEFAKERNFDPLDAEKWATVTRVDIRSKPHGGTVLYHYKSLQQALKATFPELKFPEKVPAIPKNYWRDPQHVREFFESYAKEQGFDPLDPYSWYSVRLLDLIDRRGAKSLRNYKGLRNALIESYPEVHFAKWKFPTSS